MTWEGVVTALIGIIVGCAIVAPISYVVSYRDACDQLGVRNSFRSWYGRTRRGAELERR